MKVAPEWWLLASDARETAMAPKSPGTPARRGAPAPPRALEEGAVPRAASSPSPRARCTSAVSAASAARFFSALVPPMRSTVPHQAKLARSARTGVTGTCAACQHVTVTRAHTRRFVRWLAGAMVLLSALAAAVPVAAQTPIPQLALWEAHMLTYGQAACAYLAAPHLFEEDLGEVYYDAERVFYQIADYTGDASWNTCAQRAEAVYRDQYVLSAAACWGGGFGCVPGYWNFTHGLTLDFLRTGDATSRNAVIALSQNAAFAADTTPLADTESAWRSREVAYAIMSYINAEKVGAAPRARLPALVDQALGHMDQWFGSQSFRCPSICDPPAAAR